MTQVTVEYDCGTTITKRVSLGDDQTLLANAALGDTLIMQADDEHDARCISCGTGAAETSTV